MSDGIYAALTRQVGLMREMDIVAQNIANAGTTGFKAEAMVFAEHIVGNESGAPSLSMASGHGRFGNLSQGGLTQTNGKLDMAIEGDGFFLIGAPEGERLSRAGSFTLDPLGGLVTADGYPVLDAGGAPIFLPAQAEDIAVSSDGTLSANGNPLAAIAIMQPTELETLQRAGAASFTTQAPIEPVLEPKVVQGFLEESNVSPVTEISRMILVQNAYEAGQNFLTREDERLRAITRLMDT